MRLFFGLLGLIAATAGAAPQFIKFDVRASLGITVRLTVPEKLCVSGHHRTDQGDTVTFVEQESLDGPDEGAVVEAIDPAGRVIWSWENYPTSGSDDSTLSVAAHPTLPLLLVNFGTYRYGRTKLLFVRAGPGRPTLAEYTGAQRDLFPFLRDDAAFPSGSKYHIEPFAFTPEGVAFACSPLNPWYPTQAFRFAMEMPFYQINAFLFPGERFAPVEFIPPEEPVAHRLAELQQWRRDHAELRTADLYAWGQSRVYLDGYVDYRLVSTDEAAVVCQVVDPGRHRSWRTQCFVQGTVGTAHLSFFLPWPASEATGGFDVLMHLDVTRRPVPHPALDYATTLDAETRARRLFRAVQY